MRFQAEIVRGLCRFQTQEAAADHRRFFHLLAIVNDPFQILDRAIDENALLVDARHRRHERHRARRQDDHVIRNLSSLSGAHDFLFAIDLRGAVAEVKRDRVIGVPVKRRQREFFGLAMFEVFGEIDSIVRGSRLFAKGDNAIGAIRIEFDEAFAEAVADHAVADDNDRFL